MGTSRWIVGATVLVFAAGCEVRDGTDGGVADGGDAVSELRITTETLAAGQVGKGYSQALAASGGSAPYGWLLGSKPSGLSWLSINGTSGVLSGVPSGAAPGGLEVTVSLTDQTATTVTKKFILEVAACRDGETVSCTTPTDAGCLLGSQRCANGQLPEVCSGSPSSDATKCGPLCAACGESADRCAEGQCQCGSGEPCGTGQACCGGQCKRLDAAASCGSCGNDCVAKAGAHVTAGCALGQCAFACAVDSSHTFQHCVGGLSQPPEEGAACETDVKSDAKNCGACQFDCTPTTEQARATVDLKTIACSSATCIATCVPGLLSCDGDPSNGCESAVGIEHCGGCGRRCVPGPHQTAPTCTAGSCGYSCESDYADCDGDPSNGCETFIWQDGNCGGCPGAGTLDPRS